MLIFPSNDDAIYEHAFFSPEYLEDPMTFLDQTPAQLFESTGIKLSACLVAMRVNDTGRPELLAGYRTNEEGLPHNNQSIMLEVAHLGRSEQPVRRILEGSFAHTTNATLEKVLDVAAAFAYPSTDFTTRVVALYLVRTSGLDADVGCFDIEYPVD